MSIAALVITTANTTTASQQNPTITFRAHSFMCHSATVARSWTTARRAAMTPNATVRYEAAEYPLPISAQANGILTTAATAKSNTAAVTPLGRKQETGTLRVSLDSSN